MSTRYDFTDPEAVSYCPECGLGFRIAVGRCESCDAVLISRAEALEEWRQSPPPDTRVLAWSAQAVWLFVALGWWVDRHREPRAPGRTPSRSPA